MVCDTPFLIHSIADDTALVPIGPPPAHSLTPPHIHTWYTSSRASTAKLNAGRSQKMLPPLEAEAASAAVGGVGGVTPGGVGAVREPRFVCGGARLAARGDISDSCSAGPAWRSRPRSLSARVRTCTRIIEGYTHRQHLGVHTWASTPGRPHMTLQSVRTDEEVVLL